MLEREFEMLERENEALKRRIATLLQERELQQTETEQLPQLKSRNPLSNWFGSKKED